MWQVSTVRRLHALNAELNRRGLGDLRALRHVKAVTKNLMERLLRRNGVCSISVDGMSLDIPTTTSSFQDYVLREYEPFTTEMFRQAVKPGALVLDIGAQFGYYSLIAAKRGAAVVAFEPAPSNLSFLEKNVSANGLAERVKIVPKGVGRAGSKANLFVYRYSDSHGMYPVPGVEIANTVAIECVEVDEIVEEAPVDVIKIDIEGHEPHALEGMEMTLQRSNRCILFAELAPAFLRRAGSTPEKYLARLESLNLTVRMLDEKSRSMRPLTTQLLREAERDPRWYANLYCTKGDRRA